MIVGPFFYEVEEYKCSDCKKKFKIIRNIVNSIRLYKYYMPIKGLNLDLSKDKEWHVGDIPPCEHCNSNNVKGKRKLFKETFCFPSFLFI